jgi:hypothetical protein
VIIDPLVFVLATQLATAAADKVPVLNVEPSCRGAAQVASPKPGGQMPSAAEIREACLGKERDARDQLVRQWSDFSSEHRTSCLRSTSAGGIPSYVELLTCLEIADQARKLPDRGLRGTIGMGASER